MKSMFTKGLNGIDTSAMSATDAGGLYAHNFMANMANTTWGASALGGAAWVRRYPRRGRVDGVDRQSVQGRNECHGRSERSEHGEFRGR